MNRGIVVAAIVGAVVIGGVVMMRRSDPEAPAAPATSDAPAGSRIVPKKVAPPSPIVTETPKKSAAPGKTAPAAAAPAAPVAAATLASLTLDSDVAGASVFIDRQFVGKTPLSLDKLQPGTKLVQVTATGLDSIQKTIELTPGRNAVTIRVKEVTLNARTPVVHKHGMGSCDGTLIATLDGIRYDTSNKDDAFILSYAQVEQFAVDYLQKNLRVKIKGGKTWNFTDKNDNADALLVFHRDVEAARKKLTDGYSRAQ